MNDVVIQVSQIVVIALIAAAVGLIIWAADKKHSTYGLLVPPAVTVAVAMLTWVVCAATGLNYAPDWAWLAWVLGIIVGTAAALTVSVFLGRTRTQYDQTRAALVLKQYH